jgi:AcrR family transcriptional regulator
MSTSTPTVAVTAEALKPLRADARRNRERVLVAAREVFAEQGTDGSVAEIARRAGVGAGTIFRNFPTKRDLLLAALEDSLEEIVGAFDDAEELADPWEAFVVMFSGSAEIQARNKAFYDALGPELFREPRLQEIHARRHARTEALVARAQEAGVLRADVRAEDLPFLLTAVGATGEKCAGKPALSDDLWRRYLGVVLDGLRPEGATQLEPPAPSFAELTGRCGAAAEPPPAG